MKIDLPYFRWRDGRPRWDPSPALRRLGYKGRDLKDASGRWLAFGPAIDAARAINAGIDRVRTEAGAPASSPANPGAVRVRTMRDLFQSYRASRPFAKLGDRTRSAYAAHLKLLEAWCGDRRIGDVTRAAITEHHGEIEDARGLATANAIMRTLRLVLYYGMNELEWVDRNRMARTRFEMPDGRLVLWTPAELGAFVAWADWLGCESQGDALVLGLLTGQRQADVFAMPPGAVADGQFSLVNRKTGTRAFVPYTRPLAARIAVMRARKEQRWPNVAFGHELVSSATGKPYPAGSAEFGYEFRAVRALAAGGWAVEDIARALGDLPPIRRNLPAEPVPQILGKQWRDLRDTAVTWLFAAECTEAEIATITGHSLKTVRTILDKHYFVRHEQMAVRAGVKLDAYLAASGMRF
jgi:hypothetical protein